MKIAVLMSTYNGEKYLCEQIDSILEQCVNMKVDLIIRDDGSTDKTIKILEKYANKENVRFYKGDNIGAARGFISLLRDNKGYDYYAFSDQDDIWNKDKLQRGINAISGIIEPALYCTNCEMVDANLNSIGRNTHRKTPTYNIESVLCLASCAQGCTSVFNSALAKIVQENEVPNIFIMHDSLLTCLCALIGGKIIYDDIPSMKYRMHSKNVFGMVTAKQNIKKTVKDRIEEISSREKVSLFDQAESLLNNYDEIIPSKNKEVCCRIIKAKISFFARVRLFFDNNIRHDTFNMTLTRKLKILLGNG